jgi:cytochrome P450
VTTPDIDHSTKLKHDKLPSECYVVSNPPVVTIITIACGSDPELVAADRIYVITSSIIATGMETIGHAMSQAAIKMAKHPEWLDKIWEEQQSIIATVGTDITPQVHCAFPS